MKKFEFRLEKVLKHKKRLFDIAQTKHAEAINALRKEELRLDGLRDNYKKCLYELADKTSKKFKISELGPYYRYMTFTKKDIASQSQVVCQAMNDEELARKELMKIAREKEVLLKLKSKKLREYDYSIKREEQNFLDDISAAKYARELRN